MPKHIQTQTEWEQTMARRVMEQLRGELYLDQRYLTAALGALPAAQTESGGSFATDGGALYYPAPWARASAMPNSSLPQAVSWGGASCCHISAKVFSDAAGCGRARVKW